MALPPLSLLNSNFPKVGVLIESIACRVLPLACPRFGDCPPSCPERSLDMVTWETLLVKLSSLCEWEALRLPVQGQHGGRTSRHRGTDASWKTLPT